MSAMEHEPIELGNICEGNLERQFAQCVDQVIEALNQPEEYEPTSHSIKCKIKMEVVFTLTLDSRSLLIDASAAFVPPKRLGAIRSGFIDSGVVLVEKAEQLKFPDNVTPLGDQKEGKNL